MSYCVNCGVELSDSEKKCPLCQTVVINPRAISASNTKAQFPPYHPYTVQDVSKGTLVTLSLLLFFLPVFLSVICDIGLNEKITWSGFVIGGMTLLYVIVIIPIALRKPRPILCILIDCLAVLAFLFYIESFTGGSWFFPFAFPLTVGAAIIIMLIVMLSLHSAISKLAIFADALIGIGVFCVNVELLLNEAFAVRDHLAWSQYPLITLLIIGILLLIIDRDKPLKEKLEKKFFI